METNVLWTLNLLILQKEFNMNRFHYVSTDEVYGELSDDPNDKFKETTTIKPNSPYSVSKTSWDLLTLAYHRTFWLNVSVSRCSNNYGPNQDKEKLIPHFIWLLTNNQKVTLYWDGKNIRDWLYVEDHCDAIWTIFNDWKSWIVYNIGGNTEKTNLEITKEILSGVWLDETWISFVKDRLWHDRRYAIDASKIKSELWREPKYNFEKWIKSTIEFYKDYFSV
jgi:dTDP-glucose 4,6-dehydratase